MFDVSLTELLVVALVGLLVCKPQDVPHVLRRIAKGFRTLAQWRAGLRGQVHTLLGDDIIRDLQETQQQVIHEKRYLMDDLGNLHEIHDISDVPTRKERPHA